MSRRHTRKNRATHFRKVVTETASVYAPCPKKFLPPELINKIEEKNYGQRYVRLAPVIGSGPSIVVRSRGIAAARHLSIPVEDL